MPPRRTTNFGALVEALVEDMRLQVATSVDQTLSDFAKRIGRLERYFDSTVEHAPLPAEARRRCALCSRIAVARGFCSAHYQQLRYRERKTPTRSIKEAGPVKVKVVRSSARREDRR